MKRAGLAVALWAFLPAIADAGTPGAPADRQDMAMSGPEKLIPAAANLGFGRWIEGFRSRALAAGISAATIDRAFRGVEYNTSVIEKDRNQNEFTKAIWDYLDSAVSDLRVANGRAALERHRDLLDRIETEFGVDKEVVVAVWGLESSYGAQRGDTPLIEALATLAYDGRRGASSKASFWRRWRSFRQAISTRTT